MSWSVGGFAMTSTSRSNSRSGRRRSPTCGCTGRLTSDRGTASRGNVTRSCQLRRGGRFGSTLTRVVATELPAARRHKSASSRPTRRSASWTDRPAGVQPAVEPGEAASVFSRRQPSSSNATCRLSATPPPGTGRTHPTDATSAARPTRRGRRGTTENRSETCEYAFDAVVRHPDPTTRPPSTKRPTSSTGS